VHAFMRGIFAAILACVATLAWSQHAFNLPAATDFRSDGATARREGRPVLVFFDRADCPYCERALREYLVPMSRNPQWADKATFRQVEIDANPPLIDFDGSSTTHHDYAQWFDVRLTPTILLLDADGRPLGDPIVGLLTVDFYGAYIENAIEAARRKLQTGAK